MRCLSQTLKLFLVCTLQSFKVFGSPEAAVSTCMSFVCVGVISFIGSLGSGVEACPESCLLLNGCLSDSNWGGAEKMLLLMLLPLEKFRQ